MGEGGGVGDATLGAPVPVTTKWVTVSQALLIPMKRKPRAVAATEKSAASVFQKKRAEIAREA